MRLSAVLLWSIVFVSPGAFADSIGVVTSVTGEVQILRDDGLYQAAEGVELNVQDVIETKQDASVQLEMADGSALRLGPDSRLALSEYQLDAQHNVIKAGLDVLSGWLRFAVAKLRPSGEYSINSPAMTVGIRGTEGVLQTGAQSGQFMLEEGAVDLKAPDLGSRIGAITHVAAGEFIQRRRGEIFHAPGRVPAAFLQHMPRIMQLRVIRRVQALRARGVPPRLIRRTMRDERRIFLKQQPGMRPPVLPFRGPDARNERSEKSARPEAPRVVPVEGLAARRERVREGIRSEGTGSVPVMRRDSRRARLITERRRLKEAGSARGSHECEIARERPYKRSGCP